MLQTELATINMNNIDLPKSKQLSDHWIAEILEGNIPPIDFAVKKKLIEQALEAVLKNDAVKKYAVEEIEKFGKEGATVMGAKVTVVNRAAYEYKSDPIWKIIKAQLEPLEKDLKAQEEKIKVACKTNCSLINDDVR